MKLHEKAKDLVRFYKALVENGFEKEMAWQMTQKVLTLPDELIKEYLIRMLDPSKEIAALVLGEKKETAAPSNPQLAK
jgi:hypothetical protein